MEDIFIRGLRIAFERKGEGPPLLLLHGALSDSREWCRQLDALSDELMVVAWDTPGCGHSSDPPDNFRLSDFADCLAGFIQEIGLERPHVLGLSFGSGLALELYHRHPAIPRTLLLVSTYAGWAGSLPPEVVADRVQNGLLQSEWPPEQVIEAWIPELFDEAVPADIVNATAALMSEFHPAGMRTMLRAFAGADLRPMLPTITVPTLLLYGDQDRRSPLNIAEHLHANIPGSKLEIVQGVGHLINAEVPDIFNSRVRDFLRSHQD